MSSGVFTRRSGALALVLALILAGLSPIGFPVNAVSSGTTSTTAIEVPEHPEGQQFNPNQI